MKADFLVAVEWKPQCAHAAEEDTAPRVELVEGSERATPTGVRFQVNYHVKACVLCGAPHTLAIRMPKSQEG